MLRSWPPALVIPVKWFSADKADFSRLLSLGLSHKEVVLFTYALNVYMGVLALIYRHVDLNYRILYVFNIGLFLFMSFYLVGHDHRKDPEK